MIVISASILLSSCVDKEYDWNNIDKNGIIKIPPIPLGNIDTIYLEGLPRWDESWGIPLPDGAIGLRYTIDNIFSGNAVKNFFFEGANTVEISSKIDIDLETIGVTLEIRLNVIDQSGNKIGQVVIPSQILTTGKDLAFSIKIETQYMPYMENAKDLELVIILQTNNALLWIGKDDYLFLKDAIVKTGGFHYEL
ncbi:MAG: hypothetical protein E6767_13055 [Dysgonomonas sp.]|nr:hypothetical protein [Dysgonomonas sp.]